MSSFGAEINKLKNIQQYLEKYENSFVDCCSTKYSEHQELCDLYKESSKSRLNQQEQLRNEGITTIVAPLRKITKSLKTGNIQNLDVKIMKKEMTAIQENIKNFNDNSRTCLNILKSEEEYLVEELKTFQQKVERWENCPNTRKPNSSKHTLRATENICTEVKEFMEYIATTGGHENGWTVDDHAVFLKTRNKIKDFKKVAEIIHGMLPDITEEEVIAHENWYIKYLELKEKQKRAIKDWRTNKMIIKKSLPTTKAPTELNSLRTCNSECIDKKILQKKLYAWKQEKFLQTKFELEQKQHELSKQKELEELKKQKQEELRVQVQNWRVSKKTVEGEERLRKQQEQLREQKERGLRANKLIKQFQDQDEMFIQHKLQMMQTQNKVPEALKKNRVEQPRDPLRLLKPTQQWIMRTYGEKKEDVNLTNKMNIQALPKLGMPEWRKSIL